MELEDRTQVESGLYAATAEHLLARLWTVNQQVASVLVIGHNPGLQDLALALAGGDDPELIVQLQEKFPTGAMAELASSSVAWSDLTPRSARVASLTLPRGLAD
jgi:phosphohistidine phosphatase